MTALNELRRDHLDVAGITDRLGSSWKPELLGDDSVRFHGPDRTIIVSFDPDSDPGVEWVHASISYVAEWRIPSYSDLKQMHAAVFRPKLGRAAVPSSRPQRCRTLFRMLMCSAAGTKHPLTRLAHRRGRALGL